MGRRTISNLSRELQVSRPRIYRAMQRIGIDKAGAEFTLTEWELLKKELLSTAEHNQRKKEDVARVEEAGKVVIKLFEPEGRGGPVNGNRLTSVEVSTLRNRLQNAKQEYDYNRGLILTFQAEISEYAKQNCKTTMASHNGATSAIPAIVNLEKYTKLNIALSKLITDIEADLDLEQEEGDDPFG